MKYWIWLSQLPGVGPVLQKRLVNTFQTPENIHAACLEDLIKIEGIGQTVAEKILKFRVDRVLSIEEKVKKLGIKILTSQSNPDSYREIFACKRSPILFFYRGELPLKRGIAVVGSRRCTEDAKRAAEEISRIATHANLPVISGLAKGVDSYAHTASIKSDGKTMAVLGCGVDVCYPPEHKSLYRRIVEENGAVISAYPPGVRPHPKFFLERNAHISAWSTDVVVIQAAAKSGALTTAAFALEQGRKLYAVPHSIYLPEAKGSNLLLEQGAKPYLDASSLSFLHPSEQLNKQATIKASGIPLFQIKDNNTVNNNQVQASPPIPIDHLSQLEKNIINHLKDNVHSTVEQLAISLMIPETELTPELALMEMNNLIIIKGTTISLNPLVLEYL